MTGLSLMEFGVWWALVVLALVAVYELITRRLEENRMADKTTTRRDELVWNGHLGVLSLRVVKELHEQLGELVMWQIWEGTNCMATGATPRTVDEQGTLRTEKMIKHAARIAKATARAMVLGEAA